METFNEVVSALGLNTYIKPVLGGFGVVMGIVYLFGRMTGVVRSRVGRNIIAFSVILIWTILTQQRLIPESAEHTILIIGWLLVLYTLLGFNLYQRANKYANDRFGEVTFIDEEGNEKVLKRKRPERKKKPTNKTIVTKK